MGEARSNQKESENITAELKHVRTSSATNSGIKTSDIAALTSIPAEGMI